MMNHFYMYGRTTRQENQKISLFGNQFRSSLCEDPEKWGWFLDSGFSVLE